MAKSGVKAKAGSGAKSEAVEFAVGQWVVYPSHGLAQVQNVEEESVAGFALKVLVLTVPKDRMTVRVPLAKIKDKGVRPLSDEATIEAALGLLKGRPKHSRALWARRAAEFEAKINSGDLAALAEVARDCFPTSIDDTSFSQRRIYESAIERIAAEVGEARGVGDAEGRRVAEAAIASRQGRVAA